MIKRDSKKAKEALPESVHENEPKRRKKGTDLRRRYPVSSNDTLDMTEDADTLEQHRKAIANELAKAKPRDAVLLPLLKSTYGERRIFVLNEATSVKSILDKYPALCHPAVVSVLEIFLSISEHLRIGFPID